MIVLACFFLYLGIRRAMSPYLMVPIAFGILLVNFAAGWFNERSGGEESRRTVVLFVSRH